MCLWLNYMCDTSCPPFSAKFHQEWFTISLVDVKTVCQLVHLHLRVAGILQLLPTEARFEGKIDLRTAESRESFALLFKKQLGYFLLFLFIFCSSFCVSCRMLAWAAPPEDSLSESFLAVMLHIHVTSCKVPGCIQSQHEMYAMEDIYINISICQWVSNQWYQLLPSEFWIVSVSPKAGFLSQTFIKFKWLCTTCRPFSMPFFFFFFFSLGLRQLRQCRKSVFPQNYQVLLWERLQVWVPKLWL